MRAGGVRGAFPPGGQEESSPVGASQPGCDRDLPLVIGTAGHVDHGKTTLIRALTGVDTDRLEEERRRGLTIDLGFAPFTLPSGRVASVVDVPGHEKFLKNMLAGVGGMDLVLLVVAADDGVMPQTREHLEILGLLGVPRGVVVVTKTDLVDPELLELAIGDVRDALAGTFLAGAPLVPVSAQTGQGVDALVAEIAKLAEAATPRDAGAAARMPVDRVFVKQGFGTVVTGTLLAGTLHEGDAVVLEPAGVKARVRGLQVHGRKREAVVAGQRAAVNLAGAERAELARGVWLVAAHAATAPSTAVYVELSLLPGAPPLEHRDRVRVHHGTAEVLGRVAFLDREALAPGGTAFALLLLESDVAAAFGDRTVLRRYSPGTTLGGAVVLDPAAPGRRPRSPGPTLARLQALREGRFADALVLALEAEGLSPRPAATALATVPATHRRGLLEGLTAAGRVREVEGGLVAASVWQAFRERLRAEVEAFHRAQPARTGLAREALQAALQAPLALVGGAIAQGVAEGQLALVGQHVAVAGWKPRFAAGEAEARGLLVARLADPGLATEADLLAGLPVAPPAGKALVDDLVQGGEAVRLAAGIYAGPAVLEDLRARLRDALAAGPLTASQCREALNTSRKFAIPLLEYLDASGFTKRAGDVRTLAAR